MANIYAKKEQTINEQTSKKGPLNLLCFMARAAFVLVVPWYILQGCEWSTKSTNNKNNNQHTKHIYNIG